MSSHLHVKYDSDSDDSIGPVEPPQWPLGLSPPRFGSLPILLRRLQLHGGAVGRPRRTAGVRDERNM
ncbi:C6 zinc finger domain-containing protein [Metarhizium robertsii ARSEF 23]|uniref:C6 zinc finger domain-containing protein n=1 Tax=Metarhizium robertsii (strain ARSEF 23 / ATCC MYA-3075) TaxID=655844 RepID=A0A0B2X723_METRA|nr:C6 zinc finger domain-containing protein [Metarhizium robertsii ARSEF 23]KHO10688.1 C6 zinc finger domain-containing protein [Metarhizium robertsii ARSEF 23]